MSDYTNYVLRQMGLKEGTFQPKPEEEDPIDSMQGKSSSFQSLSPTAKATPIIGIAVRGSSTGGLPSGKNLSPSKLGGYAPVNLERPNSEVLNKTPKTGVIQNGQPKVPEGGIPNIPSNPHPHQTQKNSDEPPQKVTGAEATDDPSLKTKDGAVEIDVQEQGTDKETHESDPEGNAKDAEQFRKDRANSPEGEEVRKHLNVNESTFSRMQTLAGIRTAK
jgi:hypothetical protein